MAKVSKAQAIAFIAEIAPLIQAEAKKRGYKVCSPIIAQACKESGFNTSGLSKKYHNYFGMKCGSSWKGASVNLETNEEYTKGTLTTILDNFRVYPDMVSGVAGYFDFISTKRYANLKSASTPLEYLERIKADGYCTSYTYVTSCMNDYIKPYDLTKFDTFSPVSYESNTNPYPYPQRLLKRADKGEDVKWLQWELVKRGYKIGNIDGIYGNKTYTAVVSVQKNTDGKLAVDGICGKYTREYLKG